jgi:hypothetical protein
VITGIVSSVPLILISYLLSRKNIGIKILGLIIALVLNILFIYIVLVTAAIMELEKINSWTIIYISSVLNDIFCMQLLKSVGIISTFNAVLGMNNKLEEFIFKLISKNKEIVLFFMND